MSGKCQRRRQDMRDSELWETSQGWWKGKWEGGEGDWVMGTEGSTWQDEHWVLCYMLAN